MPPSERRNYTFDTEKDEVDGGDIRNGAHGHECEDGAEHHEKSEKYSDDIWTDGVNPAARGCCYVDVVSYWYQQAGTDDEYPAYPHQAVNGFYRLPPQDL